MEVVLSQPTMKVSVAKASTGAVLVIHEERNLDLVVRPLKDAGYRVVWARSTKQGLEEAVKDTFDVVLVDLDLSEGPVADALSIIPAYEPSMPLIAVAKDGAEAHQLDSVALHDWLDKPVRRGRLLEVMEAAMEKARGPNGRLRTDVKEATPFTTGATAPAISFKRTRPQNIPTMPPGSSNKLAGVLASLRVELEPIFDANQIRIVGYEARVHSEGDPLEPARTAHPSLLATAGVELLRKRARDLAVQAFAGAPRGTKLFLDVYPADLLDAELYTPDAPLSRIADRVVLQLRDTSSLPFADLGPRISILRFLGFRLAVGDLEGGPSRLSLIADVAPEYVKIDATLTKGIDLSSAKRRVVEGLVAMARMLGSTPIADGVSTAEERATLMKLGCSLVQGPLHKSDTPAVATQRSRRHSRRLAPVRRPNVAPWVRD